VPADVHPHAPASATSDRGVPPPIRLLAQLCRSCVPSIRQLPNARHHTPHLSANTSIGHEWSCSCHSSCCHRASTAQMIGKRQRR
jgi:hypothetical protein